MLPDEGVGPEVVGASLDVHDLLADSHGLAFDMQPAAPLPRPGPYGPELTELLDTAVVTAMRGLPDYA